MIGFTGLSHLGIVSSIAAASKGFDVFAHDPDASLCAALAAGQFSFFEPGLTELLTASRSRIRFTADARELAGCQVIYFSRDVPTGPDNQSDLSAFPRLLNEAVQHATPETTLVLLNQVPPGYTRSTAQALGRSDLNIHYQVETLIFGRAVERALQPERFIVGCADPTTPLPAALSEFLASFGCPVMPMLYESAELCKISINLCLVSSVSVANTLAELCEAIGANWSEIAPALKLDRRIGPHSYLSPGLGIAGGNLERDLQTVINLAAEHGTDARVIEAYVANSHRRRDWALRVLKRESRSLLGFPTVAVWGLAYKQDTNSTKNSPALALIDAIPSYPIRAYDPQARLDTRKAAHVVVTTSALEAAEGADVLMVMTPWAEFASADASRLAAALRGRLVIDPYGLLSGHDWEAAGFRYFRLGTSSSRRRAVA